MRESLCSARNRLYCGIFLLHACPLVALAIGPSTADWIVLFCLWPFQAIGSTLGLHRYFAHKSFKTSRVFQGFLALCAALAFGDPIGFTGKHRIHHKFSDKAQDVHSPRHGLWHCWIGSLVDFRHSEAEVLKHAKDLCRYPELVWLHKHKRAPGILLCAVLFAFGGFSMVAIGFALGVVLVIQIGSAVNYFCHTRGSRRYNTGDDSTNNWVMALLSLGEGWHNNHHHYQSSARAGFFWWEIDLIYWLICAMEKLGLVWSVRVPPTNVYDSDLVIQLGQRG